MVLNNKVVVVTGGAGKLGQEFCRAISESGGIAVVADVDLQKAKTVAQQLKNAFAIEMNITSKTSIEEGIRNVSTKFEKIDSLVNNAYPRNKFYGSHFFDVTYENFCENLNLNLGGYFLTAQTFLKFFIGQGHGNVINISSIYGVIAPKFEVYDNTKMTMPVEYAAIKSGLIHLTEYMAKYMKGKNIRVNTISPGGILDSQPEDFLRRYKDFCLNKGMLDSKDIVGALKFLLSNESEFINGQNIVVDDGFTL